MKKTYFDELGGKPCLERVHQILYDKLFTHPWLKDFFQGRPRWFQESQQTDFMTGLFGGPKCYGGRLPDGAHQHLFITEEIFLLRHNLLRDALNEADVPEHLQDRWLRADWSMRHMVVKKSVDQCKGRYNSEAVIVVDKPAGFSAK